MILHALAPLALMVGLIFMAVLPGLLIKSNDRRKQ